MRLLLVEKKTISPGKMYKNKYYAAMYLIYILGSSGSTSNRNFLYVLPECWRLEN